MVAESRRRRRQRRRTAWIVVAGLVVLFAVSFGVTLVVRSGGGGDDPSDAALLPTTPATEIASEPEEERLTSASRLGYAGLGPIELGMTIEEAERAGKVGTANTGCGLTFDPASDTGLRYGDVRIIQTSRGTIAGLDISSPEISTISGVRIGSTREDVHRTYPSAVDHEPNLNRIENLEGRRITFLVDRVDVVTDMSLRGSELANEIDPRC